MYKSCETGQPLDANIDGSLRNHIAVWDFRKFGKGYIHVSYT